MMVICSPAICRGLGETHPSSSRRTPGSRDRRTLGGNQKDIKPPQPPRHGGRRLFQEFIHHAPRPPPALRPALSQRPHCASCAPAFAGETKGRVEEQEQL